MLIQFRVLRYNISAALDILKQHCIHRGINHSIFTHIAGYTSPDCVVGRVTRL